jgi:Bacterial Ig-like domain (group 2)
MSQQSIALCVVLAVVGASCGGSSNPAGQPAGPSPFAPNVLTRLTLTGNNALTAIGETTQLVGIASWSNGTTRDVTAEITWSSEDPSVVTASSNGLATAVGLGVARIDAKYNGTSNGGIWRVTISVTPAGTFAAAGDVREPGQGTLAGVRVLEPVSGKSALTNQSGTYTLAGLAGTHLRFTKDGYEPGELDIAPDNTAYMRLQRIVRMAAGETATVPKLTHMDVYYDIGPDRCSPCRLIRILAPAAGTMRFELTWEPNPGADLYLWVSGQRVDGERQDRQLTANAPLQAGENVVYVGYYRWRVLYGSSIRFTLATSRTDVMLIPRHGSNVSYRLGGKMAYGGGTKARATR